MTLPARPDLPLLGDPDGSNARSCVRTVNGIVGPGEVLCGKSPSLHVIWDEDMENGFVCPDHAPEIHARWKPWFTHPVGACCGMPGASFFTDENACRIDGELPTIEPVRAVGTAHALRAPS